MSFSQDYYGRLGPSYRSQPSAPPPSYVLAAPQFEPQQLYPVLRQPTQGPGHAPSDSFAIGAYPAPVAYHPADPSTYQQCAVHAGLVKSSSIKSGVYTVRDDSTTQYRPLEEADDQTSEDELKKKNDDEFDTFLSICCMTALFTTCVSCLLLNVN